MKDYKKQFNDSNGIAIEQYNDAVAKRDKKITTKVRIFGALIFIFCLVCIFLALYINVGWDFLGFRVSFFVDSEGHKNWVQACSLTCLMASFTITFGFAIQWLIKTLVKSTYKKITKEIEGLTRLLKHKASIFAATVYFYDLIAALTCTFALSDEFEQKLQNSISEKDWIQDNEFDPAGLEFDYTKEKKQLIIQHEGYKYYLTEFGYCENAPFRFFFEKIHPDGRVEDVEFELPIIK